MPKQRTEEPSPMGNSLGTSMTHKERMEVLTERYRKEYGRPDLPDYEAFRGLVDRIYQRVLWNDDVNERLLRAPEPDHAGYCEAVLAIGREALGDVSDLDISDEWIDLWIGFFIDIRTRSLRNRRSEC